MSNLDSGFPSVMRADSQASCHHRINRRSVLTGALLTALSPCAAAADAAAAKITRLEVFRVRQKGSTHRGIPYVEIDTDVGAEGYGGPLYNEQALSLQRLAPHLRRLLIGRDPVPRETDFESIWNELHPGKPLSAYADGRDPLTGEAIQNTRRKARHTPTGNVVTALSAVDNALWDVRGKLAGQPVYRLLGGTRRKLRAYLSIVPGDDRAKARRQAKDLFDQGHTAQKWFFRWGPPDGEAGFAKIVGLVEGLRSDLGEKARLMFDFHVASRGKCDWDVPFAVRVAKAIEPFAPFWLEEPFSPEEIDSYRRLKGETSIPLATGEHAYSRWHIQPFLDEKLVSYVQSDPEWCGGLSELLQVCRLASRYEGVRVVPHGHHVLAAAHVVASQPESLCPMVEHGIAWLPGRQQAQTRSISPQAGYLATPPEAGLGPGIDWKRFERA